MPLPDKRHPEPIKDAIRKAGLTGVGPKAIHTAILTGTLEGVAGPYEIPFETVKYYVRQARRREAATGITDRAKQPIPDALESMAREILSELDMALKINRTRTTRDLDELAKIADIAKKIGPLAKPAPGSRGRTGSADKPRDPIADKLRKAA